MTLILSGALEEGWGEIYEEAMEKAQKEGKYVLADFTGTDWCHFCVKLHEEIFADPVFKEGVAEDFVLLMVDYPKDKSQQSAEVIAQNEELKAKYAIKGYPTVLLLDARGKVFAATGYRKTSPAEYVRHLKKYVRAKEEMNALIARAEELEDVIESRDEKLKLYGELIQLVSNGSEQYFDDEINEFLYLSQERETPLSQMLLQRRRHMEIHEQGRMKKDVSVMRRYYDREVRFLKGRMSHYCTPEEQKEADEERVAVLNSLPDEQEALYEQLREDAIAACHRYIETYTRKPDLDIYLRRAYWMQGEDVGRNAQLYDEIITELSLKKEEQLRVMAIKMRIAYAEDYPQALATYEEMVALDERSMTTKNARMVLLKIKKAHGEQ